MAYVALITLLILIQYLYFAIRAGGARGKGDVKAPAMTGDENFERALRVQLNTLEQIVITLPAMWVCAHYFRADVAAILGAVFLVGRFVYSSGYLGDPTKRGPGMIISMIANAGLIGCGLFAVVMKMF